ncbi:unnamed protein product, partial [Polarella glacialis]
MALGIRRSGGPRPAAVRQSGGRLRAFVSLAKLSLAGVALLCWSFRLNSAPPGFAMKRAMPLQEAWRTLGLEPTASRGDLKKAFRNKIREVHPDVTGDDGTMLQKVREAYTVVDGIENPNIWDANGMEDGLPAWASGMLQGILWSADCPSYQDFLEKPSNKALAVGEVSGKTGQRAWAAAWGKFSQQEANQEALRVCRQYGGKCRLIYIGSGES